MRILALIPARGGSSRLPGKNKRLLGGRPLIAWSIDAAVGIPEICDILVSTDDPEIAAIAKAGGAMVPWLRPQALATDAAGSVEVGLHAMEWYEANRGRIDGLLLLQPTSPFRRRSTMLEGISLFMRSAPSAVVGVSPAHPHPMWCLRVEGGFLRPYSSESGLRIRSQDLPAAYAVNGAFYLITPAALASSRTFLPDHTLPLLIERPEEALDIDTEFDWRVAETVYGRDSVA